MCLFLNNQTSAVERDYCPFSLIQGNVIWRFEWDPNNPDTMNRNDSVTLNVIDGLPPYSWTVSGNGFWLEESETAGLSNILYSDGTVCGSATITVTDSQDAWVEGSVRIPDHGRWQQICYDSANCCYAPGPPTTPWYYSGGWHIAENIRGKYKQTDWMGTNGGGSAAFYDTNGEAESLQKCLDSWSQNCNNSACGGTAFPVCIDPPDPWLSTVNICNQQGVSLPLVEVLTYANDCIPGGWIYGLGWSHCYYRLCKNIGHTSAHEWVCP